MKKEAFTLIELLAVIVIIAIILVIAVPMVLRAINEATKGAFQSDAKMVLQQAEYNKVVDPGFDLAIVNKGNFTNVLSLSDDNYTDVKMGIVDDKPYIILMGTNKWRGLKACGTKINMAVVNIDDQETCADISASIVYTDYVSTKGVNKPALATGMTPIVWNGSDWVETTADDPNWYSYTEADKKWANAKTADGSMWVWVPRYGYQISNGYHSSTTGTINVKFLKGKTYEATDRDIVSKNPGYNGDSQTNYIIHPAFTFGNIQLTGMWVAKFKATASEGLANTKNGDNVTNKTIKIVPNAPSWMYISVGRAFQNVRNMETNPVYGWGENGEGIDTHMPKNVEWGAIAYLSKSIYGKEDEIWINPSSTFTTGCAGDNVSSSITTGCLRSYETTNGQQSSTTGNIYGIYDTSSPCSDMTAAYVDTDSDVLMDNGSEIVNANSKYKDVYTVGNSDTNTENYKASKNKKGDAVYETSSSPQSNNSWHSDSSSMPNTDSPFFERGGAGNTAEDSGIFGFSTIQGSGNNAYSFRPILYVDDAL